jgi:hypothetical protein
MRYRCLAYSVLCVALALLPSCSGVPPENVVTAKVTSQWKRVGAALSRTTHVGRPAPAEPDASNPLARTRALADGHTPNPVA